MDFNREKVARCFRFACIQRNHAELEYCFNQLEDDYFRFPKDLYEMLGVMRDIISGTASENRHIAAERLERVYFDVAFIFPVLIIILVKQLLHISLRLMP